MNITRKSPGKAETPKVENLKVALVAELPVDARCAAATPSAVFTGDSDGPLRAWSTSDGRATCEHEGRWCQHLRHTAH